VFANKNFKKGSFLLEYVGERITKKEAERREVKQQQKSNRYYMFYYRYGEKSLWLVLVSRHESGDY
jgi:SET domain-containing protein